MNSMCDYTLAIIFDIHLQKHKIQNYIYLLFDLNIF